MLPEFYSLYRPEYSAELKRGFLWRRGSYHLSHLGFVVWGENTLLTLPALDNSPEGVYLWIAVRRGLEGSAGLGRGWILTQAGWGGVYTL